MPSNGTSPQPFPPATEAIPILVLAACVVVALALLVVLCVNARAERLRAASVDADELCEDFQTSVLAADEKKIRQARFPGPDAAKLQRGL
jgi:hypothetical protein